MQNYCCECNVISFTDWNLTDVILMTLMFLVRTIPIFYFLCTYLLHSSSASINSIRLSLIISYSLSPLILHSRILRLIPILVIKIGALLNDFWNSIDYSDTSHPPIILLFVINILSFFFKFKIIWIWKNYNHLFLITFVFKIMIRCSQKINHVFIFNKETF